MKMGKKVREYKAGDFIFAKVKGYPAWPARVQRMNGKKYFVYFYGTAETANLPPNMIFDYAENKDKFLTKTVKRRDFNDGVKQIEYDFANNVPLEQVIGVAPEADVPEGANDTANESVANETMDDSMADTTAADETMADETTLNDTGIEDSDETGALVIDEGKQAKTARKSTPKTPAKETPKAPAKEPKTPRGRTKKDEESKEEVKEDDKKEEELVSRSGRKIRPKRYLDEHTEENTTLPSPAPKKRRGASPVDKDKEKEKEKESKEKDDKEKNIKHFNAVTQAELEDLKEPFTPEDPEKENIIIAYLPSGQYIGIKLFQSRPSSFKNETAKLQWDKQAARNALTLKSQLEKGHITPQSVITQLVMDLNLTDEEKATLDKDRETEEKKSRVLYLKVEMKLMELDTKIKTCLCLEKADTELCLKILDELKELDIKPLMLLKHPTTVETIKRMRAYVGNTPSWELSESEALQFSQQAHKIRKQADAVYNSLKKLFPTPEGLSFWEFFMERVDVFKKATEKLTTEEILEIVHEPLEMSTPTAHTMKSSVEAANEEEKEEKEMAEEAEKEKLKPDEPEEEAKKTKSTSAKTKKAVNSTPAKTPGKRQSSRNKPEEKEKDKEEPPTPAAEDKTETNTDTNTEQKQEEQNKDKDPKEPKDPKEKENNAEQKDKAKDKKEKKNAKESKSNKDDDVIKDNNNKEKDKVTKDKNSKDKEKKDKKDTEVKESDVKEKTPEKPEESIDESKKESSSEEEKESTKESSMEVDKEKSTEKSDKEDNKDEKDKTEDEPRAKRSRDSKKTDPPPRSPTKRKSKF